MDNKFTQEEIKLMTKVFKQKTLSTLIKRPPKRDDARKHRSVVVYTKQFDEFAKFCKESGIKQGDAMYTAIDDFLAKYK